MSDDVTPIKKRFIAGAVCPKCSAMDTLVMYQKDGDNYRECVECGYTNKMVFNSQMRELTTRVNTTEEEIKNETQVVKLMDIKKEK